MKSRSNVFTWLDQVRERPQMFARTLHELEHQISGYYTALGSYRIVEPVPSMTHHFLIWINYRTRWSTPSGWATAIEMREAHPEKQFAEFFRLVDEYRKLVPTVLLAARLKTQHQPTGKRVRIGLDGRMKKPKRVEVLRYIPEPLHFLRFYYPNTITDDWLLMNRDGSNETTIQDAKSWVRDEFQVKRHEWEKAAAL